MTAQTVRTSPVVILGVVVAYQLVWVSVHSCEMVHTAISVILFEKALSKTFVQETSLIVVYKIVLSSVFNIFFWFCTMNGALGAVSFILFVMSEDASL